jgi:hypothetical protein
MAKLSKAPVELTDYGTVPTIYIDGIGRIDSNGAISHLIMFMRRHECGMTHRTVELRLIVPTAELATMARQLACPDMADTEQCSNLGSDADFRLLLN